MFSSMIVSYYFLKAILPKAQGRFPSWHSNFLPPKFFEVKFAVYTTFLGFLAVLCFSGCGISAKSQVEETVLPSTREDVELWGGPMVQLGNTDGMTGMVISWRTSRPSIGRVEYGPAGRYDWTANNNFVSFRHEAILKGLKPDSSYSYRVLGNDKVLAHGVFRTRGKECRPCTFAVIGDSGSGSEGQYKVAEEVNRQNVDLILHTGDVVYPRGEDENYRERFYRPYKELLSRALFFPSLGNHDYQTDNGGPWLKNFSLPGFERYYSFEYGNSLFVALDSNRVETGMIRWLEDELRQTDKKWKFVFFHRPPFSNKKGKRGSRRVRYYLVPIFEKYAVDIVFSGHHHMYTRFKKRHGVHYIVEGLGDEGRHQSKMGKDVVFTDSSGHGFGLVEIRSNKLKFQHVSGEGNVLDSFTINK